MFAAITELREALEAQRKDAERLKAEDVICPWVFHRKNGSQIHSFRKAWTTACIKVGCPRRIPHDFRRTAVCNLVRAGVADTIAMKVTGRKTRAVFDRYDITSEEDLAETSRKLQARTGTIDPLCHIRGNAPEKKARGFNKIVGDPKFRELEPDSGMAQAP